MERHRVYRLVRGGPAPHVIYDREFDHPSEAETYVAKMNYRTCGHQLDILYSKDEEAIRERCLDPKWAHLQNYFLEKPDLVDLEKRTDPYRSKL